jgi:hypothetical protein
MPRILRFGLLMESLSSCTFLLQVLSCLIKISSVFSLMSILYSSSCFPLVLVYWSVLPLCFVLFFFD